MSVPDPVDIALWFALTRLVTKYWAEVDERGGDQAHGFYTRDATYAVGENRFTGEAQIRAFYEARRQRGHATTRHQISNVLVFPEGVRRARMTGAMNLYRAEGRPPIEESRPLAMIADFEAVCVLDDDGLWRMLSHVLRPVFVGSDRPFSVTVDPERLMPRKR